jgi:hypothetical protein
VNNLGFKILPSPESNDHQVRIVIDGHDFLGDDYLGIDPPEFFSQDESFNNNRLLIGRCICGCVGCDDFHVNVSSNGERVVWAKSDGLKLEFEKESYEELIIKSKGDQSWEDIFRRTERIISDFFKDKLTADNYKFGWASTRVTERQVTLSFFKGLDQKLLNFTWHKESPDDTLREAKRFLEQEKIK